MALYKYYRIPDTATLENIIGEKPTIKFGSAFDLNDPFELKFNLNIDPGAPGQKEAFLAFDRTKTEKDYEDWKEQVQDNTGNMWYVEQQYRAIMSNMVTLCSFTETNDNNLMWSHYTDNHEGICVEYYDSIFDELGKHKDFFASNKVIYTDEPPMVDALDDMPTRINKMVFHKQSEWKYERESRIIFDSNQDKIFVPIDRSLVKNVYIGSRCPEQVEGKAIALCKAYGFGCYLGITLGKTYKVSFEPYKEGTFYTRTFWKPRPKPDLK